MSVQNLEKQRLITTPKLCKQDLPQLLHFKGHYDLNFDQVTLKGILIIHNLWVEFENPSHTCPLLSSGHRVS